MPNSPELARIVYIRSHSVVLDGRLGKYLRAAQKAQFGPLALTWLRSGESCALDGVSVRAFTKRSAVGGKWGSVHNYALWWLFIISTLVRERRGLVAVHAVDFDTVVPAYLFCRIFRRKLIFDIYDHFADSRNISGYVGRFISWLERWIASVADMTIPADERRLEQHGLVSWKKLLVVQNVPEAGAASVPRACSASFTPIRLGYFGILERKHRGLENLLQFVGETSSVELVIAGVGPLAELCADAAAKCPRINFLGGMSHGEGMEMLSGVDVIIGMYYLSNRNHKYAAPNKYFEHLMLGKPLLTSRGTLPGDKVERLHTGWAIGDTVDDMRGWLQSLEVSYIEELGKTARYIWVSEYECYTQRLISGEYMGVIEAWSEKIRRSARPAD